MFTGGYSPRTGLSVDAVVLGLAGVLYGDLREIFLVGVAWSRSGHQLHLTLLSVTGPKRRYVVTCARHLSLLARNELQL